MKHNCNNWSDTFAKFLLGNGIPEHIISMPQAVMDSPMGRMLMPQLMQTTNASRQNGSLLGIQENGTSSPPSKVKNVSNLGELDAALEAARDSCAAIFYTSATCPPCKTLYPLYEEMATELAGKATLIKVDVSRAVDVGQRYSVRATPTFITFLRGEKENQWSGADPSALRGNIRLLAEMAWPRHAHESLNLPSFSNPGAKPVLYAKMPPMPKLLAKMGDAAKAPAVLSVKQFLEARAQAGAAQAVLPDLVQFASFLRSSTQSLPLETMFPVVDLFRCTLVDPRVSSCFAEEKGHETVTSILSLVNINSDCPYALRLVTLQMVCNLFSSPLYEDQILHDEVLRGPLVQLITSSFLDGGHGNVRVAASSLMFNVALASAKARGRASGQGLPEGDQIELVASVLEAIAQEQASFEALQGMLLALGHLVYRAPLDGELADLLRTMEANETILAKKSQFAGEKLVTEVGSELLGKGLRRP